MTWNRKQSALRELDDAAGELLLAVQLIESDSWAQATAIIENADWRLCQAPRDLHTLRAEPGGRA